VSAEHLGDLLARMNQGEISGKLAKEIFPKMFESGKPPASSSSAKD
jgi:aspartyl-tRNA(Asn)/glutamyl-tRNA(Gln) amidotransferase subunit B